MKKNSIVQFVGFTTNLGADEFAPNWERYAGRLMNKKKTGFQQQFSEGKNKFNYLSQHEWSDAGAHFNFMNERKSDHFPEHNVRVTQLGGYLFIDSKKTLMADEDDNKIVVFISHDETDIAYYRQLPSSLYNIYQAYYESCLYGYVVELFVPPEATAELLQELKQRHGVETGIFKERMPVHA